MRGGNGGVRVTDGEKEEVRKEIKEEENGKEKIGRVEKDKVE